MHELEEESSTGNRRAKDSTRLAEHPEEGSCSCSCFQLPAALQLSCRHILAVMSFLGFACAYALRVNLSVALVAMLNDTEGENNNTTWVRIKYITGLINFLVRWTIPGYRPRHYSLVVISVLLHRSTNGETIQQSKVCWRQQFLLIRRYFSISW